jgi:hypothetical protein
VLEQIITLWFLCSLFCAFSLCLPLGSSAQKRWIIAQVGANLLVTVDTLAATTWVRLLAILILTIMHAEAFSVTGGKRPFRIRHVNLGPALFFGWLCGLWYVHHHVPYPLVATIHFSLLHLCQLRAHRKYQVENNANHHDMQNHIRYLLAAQHNERIEQQVTQADSTEQKAPIAANSPVAA